MIPLLNDTDSLIPLAVVFGLACVRMGFLFLVAPVFGVRILPPRMRAAAAVVLALALCPGLSQEALPELEVTSLIIALLGEAALGAAAGLAARLIFAAVEGAGQLMGVPMGLGFSVIVDPTTNTSAVVTTRFLGAIVALVFLALDGHHMLLKSVAASFHSLPPGSVVPSAAAGHTLVESAGLIFKGMAQLAAPVIIVLLGVMASLGLLARIAPKINLFVLSFAISIGLGLFTLRAVMPEVVMWTKGMVLRIEPLMFQTMAAFE